MPDASVINVPVTACGCGRYIRVGLERCFECSRELRRREQERSMSPNSEPSSSRKTSADSSRPSTPVGPARPSHALNALNNAFASEEALAGFFPTSNFRSSRKAPQIRTASVPSQRHSQSGPSTVTGSRHSFEEHRAGALDKRSLSDDGYAPMAAAFVRAARRVRFADATLDGDSRGRSESVRSGLELEARLFDGVALIGKPR
ncbi:hypothetical protein CERZMDRAFT_83229 [Cercospora zeae-maydis SCOH1-5]|uniref:Uncharacterized protein n=1 Tax=Cercospora zeae-maydis SCOH1-5 TaxID=717836 RepID=A0A6A6FK19_9PEZI|nr:hypothetical protein CERZMDRAFT_83229 [Cercospora zeae-maydis SCOH1-5]